LETLNSRLKLSDIDPVLGAELSRKIEVDADDSSANRQDDSDGSTEIVISPSASNSSTVRGGSVSSRISRFIVPPSEESKSVDTQSTRHGKIRIQVVINMFRDIFLVSPMEFEMIVPVDYITAGNLRIRVLDRASIKLLQTNTEVSFVQSPEGDILHIPWMEGTKYPLSVWFFVIRDLFKKPLPPGQIWTSSVSLNEEFCISSVMNKLKNQQQQDGSSAVNLICGVGKTRGKRNYMEDVDFAFQSFRVTERLNASTYGVLDGHGGKQCADFALEDLPSQIASNLRNGLSFPDTLYTSFVTTDKEFLDSEVGQCNAGCTANVLLYDQERNIMFAGNTGDTRSVLCRYLHSTSAPTAFDLTIDRKATDPEEVARIAKAGGFVVNGRVLGSLAISRALGDRQLKDENKRIVIPDPEISGFIPSKRDQFLIIATDGLWDVMTSQKAVEFVNDLLVEDDLLENVSGRSNEEITLRLNQICLNVAVHAVSKLKSADNVTVMIIIIQGGKEEVMIDPAANGIKQLALSDTFSWLIGSYVNVEDPLDDEDLELRGINTNRGREVNKGAVSVDKISISSHNNSHNNLNAILPSTTFRVSELSCSSHNNNNVRNTRIEDDDDDELMSFLKDDSNF